MFNFSTAYDFEIRSSFSSEPGSSNIASVRTASHRDRKPRAPSLYSTALLTIKSNAPSEIEKEISSKLDALVEAAQVKENEGGGVDPFLWGEKKN